MNFVFSIARRYVFATDTNGRPALIPYIGMFGVALGVAVLIVVNAIYTGYSETMQHRLLAISGHIQVQNANGHIPDWQSTARLITGAVSDEQGEVEVLPVLQRQVLLRRHQIANLSGIDVSDPTALLLGEVGSFTTGEDSVEDPIPMGRDQAAQLSAYPPQALADKFNLPYRIVAALERGELVLGRRLAQAMGIKVGQKIRLIAPPPDITSSDPDLQAAISTSLTVGALADFGLYMADTSWAVISYERAASLLKAEGQANVLEVFLADLDELEAIGSSIQGTLGFGMLTYNMRTQVEHQTAYIRLEQQLIALVVGMTLLVASVGIVSGLVMLVHDKRREIAVIRTMGAKQSHILQIFLLAGGGIGLIGLGLGVGFGCLIALNADDIRLTLEALIGAELFPAQHFNLTELPSKLEWPMVAMVALFAMILSVIASLYPAWRASTVEPIFGLRDA